MPRNDRARHVRGPFVLLTVIGVILGLATGTSPSLAANEITLTIDGVPFDQSRSNVQDERMIQLEGSSIVLATWNERVGDAITPYFGVSLDGRTLVRVAPTTYELGLRYAHFDPLASVPEVAPELAARVDGRLYLVQFVTQPLEYFNEEIEALGGTVHHYVAQLAYLVEMDGSTRDAVAALPFVRWVGPYHPAYRLEEFMLENLDQAHTMYPSQAYNIQVMAVDQKSTVANRIQSIGGTIQNADAGKVLVEAVLTPEQLFDVVTWDQVLFVDRWGPYESDMDIAREIGGANFLESVTGFSGQGVRGEVFDAGFNLGHVDFAAQPLVQHGTVNTDSHGASTSGIVFGDGTGDPNARGLLPDAQGIVADYDYFGLTGGGRYAGVGELLQPPYLAVFQTSSVGSPRTTQYTTISADHDATLFDFDISLCQSQSNSGNQDSRPQAWAKNIISGGGLYHYNTLTKADDCWCGGASIGPASDGRIKPTFTHFYDGIRTVGCCGATSYTSSFGGTSGATPIICGYVGLFYEMWGHGIFGNPVLNEGDIFGNRSHMTTAKAMLVNSAEQYDFSGTNHDHARNKQGWGMPSVQNLYDKRSQFLIVNETQILEPFQVATRQAVVSPGASELKVTMTYADPPGNPAVQTQHRINDLDLKVTSPSGWVYWGNNGLLNSPYSAPGGSPDTKNTVENVFVAEPQSGTWTIEVIASEVIQDGHVETAELDVDFALVVSPVGDATVGVNEAQTAGRGLRLAILPIAPGSPEAKIGFELADPAQVRLQIFDVNGRIVASLQDGMLASGAYELIWDGMNDAGSAVEAGVYFARLDVGGQKVSGKVLVLR